jgi:hypothetical protein
MFSHVHSRRSSSDGRLYASLAHQHQDHVPQPY